MQTRVSLLGRRYRAGDKANQSRAVDFAAGLTTSRPSPRQCRTCSLETTNASAKAPIPVPRSIHDVDAGKLLGFGAELAEDHPGFKDEEYKRRRVSLANLAKSHQIGEAIPRVSYTEDEVKVWSTVLSNLKELLPKHACEEFLRAFSLFQFREDSVPQLQDVSDVLQASTGWKIRPVAGLMHPRDFLAGLAFQTFHSTQYIRHPSKPSYTPEPDVVHELIGHVPLLADPGFAAMVQALGHASLGVDDKQIWHLTKVYWYTVEFGVVRERGQIKAFGAGILSSYGELKHMAEGKAQLEELDPFKPQPKMSYRDGYQQRYFVLDSFDSGRDKLLDYATKLRLPAELSGDASVA